MEQLVSRGEKDLFHASLKSKFNKLALYSSPYTLLHFAIHFDVYLRLFHILLIRLKFSSK